MPDKPATPLYLFAKEPVAGQVKTRLAPAIGDKNCVRLATQMLQQSVEQVSLHWPGSLVLCVAPRLDAPLFREITKKYRCEKALQEGQDLGERMQHALETGIAQTGASAVMGCDVPHISAEVLRLAGEAMATGQNVVGPAEDGGFYFLGVQKSAPDLFANMVWGSSGVFARLMENAERLEVEFTTLPTLRDIDLWDDLVWLSRADSRYLGYTESIVSLQRSNP